MNQQAIKYAAFTLAGIVLFAASFFLFAVLSGTPLNELAVVGGMFSKPETEQLAEGDPEPDLKTELDEDRRPPEIVISNATSPLQAFLLQSPFSTEELGRLQKELKEKITANEARQIELNQRERDIGIREQHLAEKWDQLAALREGLNDQEFELAQRGDELDRDQTVALEQEEAGWRDMAPLFEGDEEAKSLKDKLLSLPPEKAAILLRALPVERAAELMNVLNTEDYRRYTEAYRAAGSKKP